MKKKILIILIICITIMTNACTVLNTSSTSVNDISEDEIANIIEAITTLSASLKNNDGGYSQIPSNYSTLYYTYHSIKALSYTNYELDKYTKEKLINWLNNFEEDVLFDENGYDSMHNMYYYVMLLQNLGGDLNSSLAIKIRNEVKNLQDKEGYFYLSKRHNMESMGKLELKPYDALKIMATLKATKVLNVYSEKPIHLNTLSDWIREIKYTIDSNDDIDENIANLSNIIEIANILDIRVEEGDINEAEKNLKVWWEHSDDNPPINVILIYNALKLQLAVDEYKNLAPETPKYIELLELFINTDWSVSLEVGLEGHILPTCLLLEAYSLTDTTYSNVDVVDFILDKQIYSGAFVESRINSEIDSSYFVYKTLKLINGEDYIDPGINSYLSQIDVNKLPEMLQIFYLRLIKENGILNVNDVEILDNLYQRANNVEIKANYLILIDLLEVSRECNYPIDLKIKEKLLNYALDDTKYENLESVNDKLIFTALDLKVLGLIEGSITSKTKEKFHEITKILNSDYDNITEKIYSFYWILNSLDEFDYNLENINIDKSIRKKMHKDVISYESNGAFRFNEKSEVSMQSTYYALYVIKKLY